MLHHEPVSTLVEGPPCGVGADQHRQPIVELQNPLRDEAGIVVGVLEAVGVDVDRELVYDSIDAERSLSVFVNKIADAAEQANHQGHIVLRDFPDAQIH